MELTKYITTSVDFNIQDERIRYRTDKDIQNINEAFDGSKQFVIACQREEEYIQFYRRDHIRDGLEGYIFLKYKSELDKLLYQEIKKQGSLIEGQVARDIFELYRKDAY